jgi:hypothetical protein
MSIKGQTTCLAERVEIGERWKAGQSDPQIAQAVQRPLSTVRKWRRRYQRQGREGLCSQIGRPRRGALGQFSSDIVAAIAQIRQAHTGWGPLTILTEIGKDPRFVGKPLPSRSRLAAYFKQQSWVKAYQRHHELPEPKVISVERAHQEWEMDAQGVLPVKGLGSISLINIVDVFSHVKVGSLACLHKTHANTQDHQLALRHAFQHYGLPEQISLDHDSVFYDNRSGSPFPTGLHLWLIGLGLSVRFIHQSPPAEHARIERAHQCLTRQALTGQTFQDLAELQNWLDERLDFLNADYPCRTLRGQPPLKAFPQAYYSSRPYHLEQEKELLDMQRVYTYLAQGRWFRSTSSVGMFSLGSQRYNARTQWAEHTLEITFDPHTCEFICLPEKGSQPIRLAAQGLTKEMLMGELDPLLSVPAHQLSLPFSPQTWRELLLSCQLSGTTL